MVKIKKSTATNNKFQIAAVREFFKKNETKGKVKIQKIPVPFIPPVRRRREKQKKRVRRKRLDAEEKPSFPKLNRTRSMSKTIPSITSIIPRYGIKRIMFAKPKRININEAIVKKTTKLFSFHHRLNFSSILKTLILFKRRGIPSL